MNDLVWIGKMMGDHIVGMDLSLLVRDDGLLSILEMLIMLIDVDLMLFGTMPSRYDPLPFLPNYRT